MNQAVVFTKPLHHLGLSLTPEDLAGQTASFFETHGFNVVFRRRISGPELARRNVIREHYLIYSQASCCEDLAGLELSPEARGSFESVYGVSWDAEVLAGRLLGNPALQAETNLNAVELYALWIQGFEQGRSHKLQDGLLVQYIDALDRYCINGFYPSLEYYFNHPQTDITYYVMEFDEDEVSWLQFRKEILGATNAAQAVPDSFRGRLYGAHQAALSFPNRDNFVHGSAGPLEAFIERSIHEADFDPQTSPVGRYFLGRGISLEQFRRWKSGLNICQLGELYDRTEEKSTEAVLPMLDSIQFER